MADDDGTPSDHMEEWILAAVRAEVEAVLAHFLSVAAGASAPESLTSVTPASGAAHPGKLSKLYVPIIG